LVLPIYAVSYVYMDRFLVTSRLSAPALLQGKSLLLLRLPHSRCRWLRAANRGWQPGAVVSLVTLGRLGTGAGFVLNYRISADDGASAASLVTYLRPVTALLLGAVVLQERPTSHAIVGTVIVLAGVSLARFGVMPRSSPQGRLRYRGALRLRRVRSSR
jgi:drug/metabolite transporter (DMT)-like permease